MTKIFIKGLAILTSQLYNIQICYQPNEYIVRKFNLPLLRDGASTLVNSTFYR